ncbi:MAG: hypothetical protein ACI4DN_05250 [Lachnospiraceae bacterium]
MEKSKDTFWKSMIPVAVFLLLSYIERELTILVLERRINISYEECTMGIICLGSIYIISLLIYIKCEKNIRRLHCMIAYISYLSVSALCIKDAVHSNIFLMKVFFKLVHGPLSIIYDTVNILSQELSSTYYPIIIFHFLFIILTVLFRKKEALSGKRVDWFLYFACYSMALSSLVGSLEISYAVEAQAGITALSLMLWIYYMGKGEKMVGSPKLWNRIWTGIATIKALVILNHVMIHYNRPFTGILMLIEVVDDKFLPMNIQWGEWISLGMVIILWVMELIMSKKTDENTSSI